MEAHITPERTANAIMQDTQFNGYYLIVEGNKDVKLYGKFINESNIKITPAFGNEKVKKVLEILDERGFEKRVGIIDSDFQKILNITEDIGGLFITDEHDIEVMIIKTKALENVLNVYCSSQKIKEFEKNKGTTIREALLSLGKEIGYLKLANKVYDLGLVFKPKNVDGKQIKYNKFICEKTFNFLGAENLIDATINYSRNRSDSLKEKEIITEKFIEISEQELDLMQLVNGHDLSNFLYILMKKILKSRSRMLNDFNCIEDSLILAYEFSYFQETDLFTQIVNWSKEKNVQIFAEKNDS